VLSVRRYMEPGVIAVLGGVLPFGSIFIEMYAGSYLCIFVPTLWGCLEILALLFRTRPVRTEVVLFTKLQASCNVSVVSVHNFHAISVLYILYFN